MDGHPETSGKVPAEEAPGQSQEAEVEQSLASWVLTELVSSPVNLILVAVIVYLIYKILKPESGLSTNVDIEPPLAPMKKRDFTPRQLKEYDGTGEDGRVLVAILGKVYDVTRGKNFYGPGGAYSSFAGRDASRALATFSVQSVSEEHDDLSDLKPSEMEQVREWDLQFSEKYPLVGRLLKPGEQPTTYSDDEDDDEEAIAEEQRKLRTASSVDQLKKTS